MPCVICDAMASESGAGAGGAEAGVARRGRLGRERLGLSPAFSDEAAGLRTVFNLPRCRWAAQRKKERGPQKGHGRE